MIELLYRYDNFAQIMKYELAALLPLFRDFDVTFVMKKSAIIQHVMVLCHEQGFLCMLDSWKKYKLEQG